MRSLSDQFLLMVPALFALVLLGMFAAPMHAGSWPLTPNIAWVMTLVIGAAYPPAWPRWFAFALGLVQDVLFGTPLGSQALLVLLLTQLMSSQFRRQSGQPFLIRWLEAAGALVLWHVLLWGLFRFVTPDAPPLTGLVQAGITSALWFPLFFLIFSRLVLLLPPIK